MLSDYRTAKSLKLLARHNGRVYDPVIARFLSVDPLIQLGSTQSPNSYAYVWNNPLTMVDPSGFQATDVTETGSTPRMLPQCPYQIANIAVDCEYRYGWRWDRALEDQWLLDEYRIQMWVDARSAQMESVPESDPQLDVQNGGGIIYGVQRIPYDVRELNVFKPIDPAIRQATFEQAIDELLKGNLITAEEAEATSFDNRYACRNEYKRNSPADCLAESIDELAKDIETKNKRTIDHYVPINGITSRGDIAFVLHELGVDNYPYAHTIFATATHPQGGMTAIETAKSTIMHEVGHGRCITASGDTSEKCAEGYVIRTPGE